MPQSDVTRLLASRPSGAALASLFSDHSAPPVAPRKPHLRMSLGEIGRKIVRRVRETFLSQVPCEDTIFHTPPTFHYVRRRTQM